MINKTKQLIKIIKDICKEENMKFESFSDDWIIQLTNEDNEKVLIYNYKFPNNNAAVSKICDDKAALSDVLNSNSIPHVEHIYFEREKRKSLEETGVVKNLLELLKKHNKLVLKANFGSGGNKVYKCSTPKEVEEATFNLLKSNRSMCASPYINIDNEYRVIVLKNKAMLTYVKQRPSIIGDGVSTVKQLIKNIKLDDRDLINSVDLNYIPKKKEVVVVSWKHNLAKGSLPVIIKEEKLLNTLNEFAIFVAKKLNIGFASIDIIEENGEFKILEINSGIMMEVFSSLNKENYEIAKFIYKSAICDYFKNISKDRI